jgi:hypothetical protein
LAKTNPNSSIASRFSGMTVAITQKALAKLNMLRLNSRKIPPLKDLS